MAFRYYWDGDLFEALLRYRMLPFLADILAAYKGEPMASAADIQKLVEGMKRAKALTERAATTAPKHAAIMDAFEARLGVNDENMAKIAEYEKQMAAMDAIGNGGPALDSTFQADAPGPTTGGAPTVTGLAVPEPLVHMPINYRTGDPVK